MTTMTTSKMSDVELQQAVLDDGSKVILHGTVRSWAERQEAERVAWSAPGVTTVENLITVEP